MVLHLEKVWLKLNQRFWWRILNFVYVFSLFRNYLPLANAGPFIWTNLNPLHPRLLCVKFAWNCLSGSKEESLKMYFHYFVIISLWKKAVPFIWTKMNPFYPRMLCAKFGRNWSSGSGEEDCLNFVNVVLLFRNYLTMENAGPFIWNNLNPNHPRMHCAKFIWNWSSGSGEDFFLNFVNVFPNLLLRPNRGCRGRSSIATRHYSFRTHNGYTMNFSENVNSFSFKHIKSVLYRSFYMHKICIKFAKVW